MKKKMEKYIPLDQINQVYPDSVDLKEKSRDQGWVDYWRKETERITNEAIALAGVDMSPSEWRQDWAGWAFMGLLGDSLVSSNGFFTEGEGVDELIVKLQKSRFGEGKEIKPSFTANHDAIPLLLIPVDENDNRMPGAMIKHIPLRPSKEVEGEKKFGLGEISPVKLEEVGEEMFLVLETPKGNKWRWKVESIEADDYYSDSIGFGLNFGDREYHCASEDSMIINLRESCGGDCSMCGVPRGDGEITWKDKFQLMRLFRTKFENIEDEKGAVFGVSLSGGSVDSFDAGFGKGHGWALKALDRLLSSLNKKRENPIKMKLQLEFALPRNRGAYKKIIETISKYVDKDWDISLAINLEVLQDEFRALFLQGPNKSVTKVDDLVKFADDLRKVVGDKVLINSLVMFGMKPFEEVWTDERYMLSQLEVAKKLAEAGIRVDLNPVKDEVKESEDDPVELESFPPVNPAHLTLQSIAVAKINQKFNKATKHGCVGCSRCNPKNSAERFLSIGERNEKNEQRMWEVLDPLLMEVGEDYRDYFVSLFIINN